MSCNVRLRAFCEGCNNHMEQSSYDDKKCEARDTIKMKAKLLFRFFSSKCAAQKPNMCLNILLLSYVPCSNHFIYYTRDYIYCAYYYYSYESNAFLIQIQQVVIVNMKGLLNQRLL